MRSGLKNIKDQSTVIPQKVLVKEHIVKEEKKEKINFIITCYNREQYWEYLKQILDDYKLIESDYVITYNGVNNNFPAVYVGKNRGHQLGEYDCIIKGYETLIPISHRWVKLSVDSWLLNEKKILDIFNEMENKNSGYAGQFWNPDNKDISTDIMFVDTRFGNIFEIMKNNTFQNNKKNKMEKYVYNLLIENNIKIHFIPERYPVHWENREKCEKLNWTMSHDLQENINCVKKYANFIFK
jgi:hypothetical protein